MVKRPSISELGLAAGHQLTIVRGRHFCLKCEVACKQDLVRRWLTSRACPGTTLLARQGAVAAASSGAPAVLPPQPVFGGASLHPSRMLGGARGLFWCTHCGGWGTTANPRVASLSQPCRLSLGLAATRAGRDVLRRIERGLTPKASVAWPLAPHL